MKTITKSFVLALAVMLATFSGCKKEYELPTLTAPASQTIEVTKSVDLTFSYSTDGGFSSSSVVATNGTAAIKTDGTADSESGSIVVTFTAGSTEGAGSVVLTITDGEGKTIKFNLLEMLAILDTCQTPGKKWSTVHRFKVEQTPITFDHQIDQLVITIPNYQKYMKFPETRLFADLLEHIYREKLQYSTIFSPNLSPHNEKPPTAEELGLKPPEICLSLTQDLGIDVSHEYEEALQLGLDQPNDLPLNASSESGALSSRSSNSDPIRPAPTLATYRQWLQNLSQDNAFFLVPGHIEAKSKKAIAFKIAGLRATWVPLSCLKEDHLEGSESSIWIKKWFVEKKMEELLA